jgi:UDP-N-acetylmuramate-alanine ligase
MATNLALDNTLIEQAVEAGQHRSKKAAVTAALEEYVKTRRRLGILDWMGRVDYYDDYDHKNLRRSGST